MLRCKRRFFYGGAHACMLALLYRRCSVVCRWHLFGGVAPRVHRGWPPHSGEDGVLDAPRSTAPAAPRGAVRSAGSFSFGCPALPRGPDLALIPLPPRRELLIKKPDRVGTPSGFLFSYSREYKNEAMRARCRSWRRGLPPNAPLRSPCRTPRRCHRYPPPCVQAHPLSRYSGSRAHH
jgi:hypothetical protein